MPKCPPFRHYEQRKQVKSFFHEKLREVSVQTTACGRDDLFWSSFGFGRKIGQWTSTDVMTFFFGFHLILGGKLTSADVMTLKEPVLLLRNEKMATLP